MFPRKALASLFFLAVAAQIAMTIGGTTDDSVPDSRFVEYGRGFSKYTMKLTGFDGDGVGITATATAISDEWALTAAHVVDGATGVAVGGISAAKVIVHPDFAGGKPWKGDVALVRLERSFGLDWYPPLSAGGERVGQVASLAGYGIHGKMSSGYEDHEAYDGCLRAGTQTIERIDDWMFVCSAKRGSSPLEFCVAPGDSGGPMFVAGKLAGVNSSTFGKPGARSREGAESSHMRVSLCRDWILAAIATP
jgi:hypothetical protein